PMDRNSGLMLKGLRRQMTIRVPDPSAQPQSKRLHFDRYVLDQRRGCLLLEGNEIVLRPKALAVLQYLAENSGRLISKDELFAAVWPNLAVTDDALVQSIGELRRTLGADGQRLIKTIPRRGYRFESDVSTSVSDANTQTDTFDAPVSNGPARPSKAVFVRYILLASFALAVLLVSGVLWSGIVRKNGASDTKPVIAVLPLGNQNKDPGSAYFADGLTQDIINALGRFSSLTVMSWNAVLPYKDKPTNPAEIANRLAVRYQVEGNVRQIGDRLRVDAQLVDTNGQVLWAATFDEALTDLFVLQDKITTQIAGALAIRVSQAEQRRAVRKPTKSLVAYDYVLRARPALLRPERAKIAEARVLLRRAIDIDPNYAAAYAALAETYYDATSMGWAESPIEFLNRAEEMANKALSVDDSNVRAHVVLGRIHIFYHRYAQAETEIDRALAINPSDASGIAGHGNILMWSGQTDAAIAELERAQRIDPELNPMDRFALSLAYYLKGRYDSAIEQGELNLSRTAGANFSRIVLAAAYAEQNRTDDTARMVTMIRRLDPTFDPGEFGTKFLNAVDLERLRDGLRKAGLLTARSGSVR
ncbi:MAG TPA: winged helix-turn-helix domain-containing protein, partial [Pseudolabrys sp.]|nr:winged helix-turn-helix domain-containing protein [Pseudolabrys sp.]